MRGDSNDERVAITIILLGAIMVICLFVGIMIGNVWLWGIPIAFFVIMLSLALALYNNWLPDDLRYDLKLIKYLKTLASGS